MLIVDTTKYVAHRDRQLTKHCEGGSTISRRSEIIVLRTSRVSKGCPVFEFFICIQKFDRDKTIRFLECDWSAY